MHFSALGKKKLRMFQPFASMTEVGNFPVRSEESREERRTNIEKQAKTLADFRAFR